MHCTRAGICCSVRSLQWVGEHVVTNGNIGIFEDRCLQLSLTLCLLYQKPSGSVIHRFPSNPEPQRAEGFLEGARVVLKGCTP